MQSREACGNARRLHFLVALRLHWGCWSDSPCVIECESTTKIIGSRGNRTRYFIFVRFVLRNIQDCWVLDRIAGCTPRRRGGKYFFPRLPASRKRWKHRSKLCFGCALSSAVDRSLPSLLDTQAIACITYTYHPSRSTVKSAEYARHHERNELVSVFRFRDVRVSLCSPINE